VNGIYLSLSYGEFAKAMEGTALATLEEYVELSIPSAPR
jgi:hypothetical protein